MAKGRLREWWQTRTPPTSNQGARFLLNDRFTPRDLFLALLQVIVGDGLQVVDVVEVDILEEIHFRLDVAGHRDVDQKQRPVFSELHQWLELLAIEDVMRRSGAADHDIHFSEFI